MDSRRHTSSGFDPLTSRPDARSPLPGDVVRAVNWLKSHLQEPVEVETLAAAAGVRPRTLEAHFKQYLGTTPLGCLRQMRLAYARQQFLTEGDAASVTDVATASGYTQFGRFAAHYREQFGELPSQTQKRAARATNEDAIDDEAVFLTWRALTAAFNVSPRQCGNALEDLAQAQELAPRYALPKAVAAWCHGQRVAHNFAAVPSGERERTCAMAEQARALDPNDPTTLGLCSGALALAHHLHEADALVERAIAMDPWSPLAWIRRGWISAYLGDTEGSIRELNRLLHLMPFSPIRHLALIGIGCAHFAAGRYDRAARWAREGVEIHPDSFWGERIVVAAAAAGGNRDEARRSARQLLRKDPNLTATLAQRAWPFPVAMMGRLGESLEAAGVPRA